MSAAPRIPTTRYRSTDEATTVCPGCRTELPVHATFCVECGLCMLDVTAEGTVIAPPPSAEDKPTPSASPVPGRAAGTPIKVVDDLTSGAIDLGHEDVEIDIDALVAGLLETPEPTADDRMTSRFERVPKPVRKDVSATLSSDLSSTLADEIEVEVDLSDTEIETFFEEVSSPIRVGRGPLTPPSEWPAPAPGNTVIGPPPSH